MQIEVWSDIVCPWCLIGKRRLERALAQRPELDATVVFRAFELDPTQAALPEGSDLADVLARKYGMSRSRALAMMDHVAAQAAAEGVSMDFSIQQRESGSFDAHRVLQLAGRLDAEGAPGLQVALKDRLMRAWFCEGKSIRDRDALRAHAVEVGLPPAAVDSVLDDPSAFAASVRADEAQARALGVRGVPFFVFDRAVGLSGAQPVEVILQAIDQALAASAPAAQAESGDSCAIDGC